MSPASSRLSKPGSRRFSRDGFITLGPGKSSNVRPMKDATVDIPLASVGPAQASANPYEPQPTMSEGDAPEKDRGGPRGFAGRRVKKAIKDGDGQGTGDEEQATLNQMGKVYQKVLEFSFVTRYLVLVVPIALIITVPIVIGATAARRASVGGVRIVWLFTWLEVVWLGLWVSKIFARLVPSIFQFLCGIVSAGTRKYATVLAALEMPLSLVGWALVSLATFVPLMTRNPDQLEATRKDPNAGGLRRWQQIVQQILAALLVAALIFFAERLLVHLISINYHRRQFDERIKASKRHVHLLSLLYEASRTLFPAYCSEFADEDYLINDSVAAGSKNETSHHRSGSATPLRLMHNVGRVGDKITAAFGTVASEIAGKQVFNPTSAHSVVVEALEKRKSSEALARRVWMSFVVEGRDALYEEDIVEVLGPDRRNDAQEAFADIDCDGNGDISLDEMILTVVEFGRERHSIATSMADVDQAIHALDQLLCTIVFIVVIFVFVAFLNSNLSTTLATAGTALLSLSFVFATTAQEILGSCIFLFVKHPYDVGDRVDINSSQLTVEHIALLYSVFKRVDTHKVVQIPHVVLNSGWVENVSRSRAMREQINVYVNFDTTMEDINALKNELQAFVLSKENSRDFLPEIDVEVTGIAEMNKLELAVEVRHKSNWSNETVRATRRNKFMCALVLALRRIPIYGPGCGDAALGDMSKPTYSVAISDSEAETNRQAFAAKKEAKRLFPTAAAAAAANDNEDEGNGTASSNDYFGKHKGSVSGPQDTRPSTAAPSERTAVETLTTRNPAEDAARDDWDKYQDTATTPGGRPIQEARRGNDIEEVRGMLRRESTRGRRKAAGAHAQPAVSAIAEVRTPPASSVIGHNRRVSPELTQRPTRNDTSQTVSPMEEYSTGLPPFSGAPTYQSPPPAGLPPNRPFAGNAFAQQQQQQHQYQQQQQQQQQPCPPRGQSQQIPQLPPLQTMQTLPQQQPPPQRPLPRDP